MSADALWHSHKQALMLFEQDLSDAEIAARLGWDVDVVVEMRRSRFVEETVVQGNGR